MFSPFNQWFKVWSLSGTVCLLLNVKLGPIFEKYMLKQMKRNLRLLMYLFHWRTLLWYCQWPYYEIRYQMRIRKENAESFNSLEDHHSS